MKRFTAIIAVIIVLVMCSTGCSAIGDTFNKAGSNIFGARSQKFKRVEYPDIYSNYIAADSEDAYALLESDMQRKAYRAIYEGLFCITSEEGFEKGTYKIKNIIIPDISASEIYKVKEAVLCDHPEIFWVNSQYSLDYNFRDGDYIIFYSNDDYDTVSAKAQAIAAELSILLGKVPADLDQYGRERLVHDLLVSTAEYDTAAAADNKKYPDAYCIYGFFVNKKAVCSGCAPAVKLMLNRVGLTCRTVNGTCGGTGHMWNIVQIDDKWYQLDVTQDDPVVKNSSGLIYYDYFNLTDKQIKTDHKFGADFSELTDEMIYAENYTGPEFFNFTLPKCNSNIANFYEINAIKIKSLDYSALKDFSAWVSSVLEGGESVVYIMFDPSIEPADIRSWLCDGELCAINRAVTRFINTHPGADHPSSYDVYFSSVKMWNNVYTVSFYF